MNGRVDESVRALIPISVAASADDERTEILAWVDTAFNGGLTIPRARIQSLGLVQESSAEAVLADGSSRGQWSAGTAGLATTVSDRCVHASPA